MNLSTRKFGVYMLYTKKQLRLLIYADY